MRKALENMLSKISASNLTDRILHGILEQKLVTKTNIFLRGDSMLAHESGTCSGSDLYFHTPSVQTREMLFYMTSCGYYYTDYDYHITRDYVEEFLLFYICDGRLSIRMGIKPSLPQKVRFVF